VPFLVRDLASHYPAFTPCPAHASDSTGAEEIKPGRILDAPGPWLEAEVALTTLVTELEVKHPRMAASLRDGEGMDETLTVLRLGVPLMLTLTLRSTNPIEPMISICCDHAVNVKSWKNG